MKMYKDENVTIHLDDNVTWFREHCVINRIEDVTTTSKSEQSKSFNSRRCQAPAVESSDSWVGEKKPNGEKKLPHPAFGLKSVES
jgi:hypothetical protein